MGSEIYFLGFIVEKIIYEGLMRKISHFFMFLIDFD